MTFFEIENFDRCWPRSGCAGRWIRAHAAALTGIGIDSREDLAGRAFVAIKGDTHDGHDFLGAALESRAGLLIVERNLPIETLQLPPHVGIFQVENTRKGLAKLALAYRRVLRGTKVIAVTGSAGKTTTKRLIDGVLAGGGDMQGTASPKSFNNDIGLPLTILQARLSDKYLLVEIGTNAPGEIAQLSAIAEPDLAVITCIGRAHLQGLGSLEAIAKEKASILTHLQPDGVAILHADSPLLRNHFKLAKHRVLFGESQDAELRLTNRGITRAVGSAAPNRFWFEINNRHRFNLALPGKHNAINAMAAVAVGRRMGLDDAQIALGLERVEPAAMRLTPQLIGPITLCNDAYNANPDSMIAALETFMEISAEAKRRVVVLGDMLELGAASPQLHREIGQHLVHLDARTPIQHVIVIGDACAFLAAEVTRTWKNDRVSTYAAANEDAAGFIAKLLKPGDAVLLKGSRGMGLERLVPAIERQFGDSTRDECNSTPRTRRAAAPVPLNG